MTIDPFTDAARAVGADPEDVRESIRNATEYASRNGMSDDELMLWIWHAGAIYGRIHLAAQEPDEVEVLAAAWAICRLQDDGYEPTEDHPCGACAESARAALSAARAARRDEEKQ